jgi:hypothetical protein
LAARNSHIVVTTGHLRTDFLCVAPLHDGTYSFVEELRFTVSGVLFSDPAETCTTGAYLAELDREIRSLKRQNYEENHRILQMLFTNVMAELNQNLWNKVENSAPSVLASAQLDQLSILHGPEPMVGFLSYLFQAKDHDLFIGQTWPNTPPNNTHYFILPNSAYLTHIINVREQISAWCCGGPGRLDQSKGSEWSE